VEENDIYTFEENDFIIGSESDVNAAIEDLP
jgi:hypothetical protein